MSFISIESPKRDTLRGEWSLQIVLPFHYCFHTGSQIGPVTLLDSHLSDTET